MTKILEISLPEYNVGQKPDSIAIGNKLDKLIYDNFSDSKIVVRCIRLQDHPQKNLNELANEILDSGTDKYDDKRQSLAEELVPKKYRKACIYGEPVRIEKTGGEMHLVIDDFYHGALADRGYSLRIDLIMVYDSQKLEMIPNIYSGHEHSDVYIFKNPEDKKSALLGLIKVL